MMTANQTFLILFEHELRAAANALTALHEESNAEVPTMDDDAYQRLLRDALNACSVALQGISEMPHGHILITSTSTLFGNREPRHD